MTVDKKFKRLIRFIADDNETYYGDAILPKDSDDVYEAKQAYLIKGNIFGTYEVTSEVLRIKKLRNPLSDIEVPSVRCIGLNYVEHALELKLPIPEYPVIFFKPNTAITGPQDPIIVPSVCQIDGAKIDYEVEMVIVIGKQGRDIKEEDAQDYILGYTVGNDVSQRTWQIDRGGTQFGVGKMFDTFAPIGPAIVSKEEVGDVSNLKISTKVNGKTRQCSNTSDMIFNVNKIVSFLSIGTTLKPGDIVLTGTPPGVAQGLPDQPFLVDGDVVDLYVEKIGHLINKVQFEEPDETIIKLYS